MPSREALTAEVARLYHQGIPPEGIALGLMRVFPNQRIPEEPGEDESLRMRIIRLRGKGLSRGEIKAIVGCSMRWVDATISGIEN